MGARASIRRSGPIALLLAALAVVATSLSLTPARAAVVAAPRTPTQSVAAPAQPSPEGTASSHVERSTTTAAVRGTTPATETSSAMAPSPRTTTYLYQTYRLVARLAVRTHVLNVKETVTIQNRSSGPIDAVDLSVLPTVLGYFALTGPVQVDGGPAHTSFTTVANLRVSFGAPVPAGSTVRVFVPFRLTVGPTVAGPFAARLNYSNGILALGNWFPIISREHDGYGIGDPQVTFDAASITFDLTTDAVLPRSAVAASGTQSVAPSVSGRHWVFLARHVRDFAVAISSGYHVLKGSVDGIRIGIYHRSGDGATTLALVRRMLHGYATLYGRYPYPAFTVAETGVSGFSMEFPTMIFVAADRMTGPKTIAHEVAHQWFYGLLGNDQLKDPLLDESFATFSAHYILRQSNPSCSNRPVDLPIFAWPGGATTGNWFDCSGFRMKSDGHGGFSVVQVHPMTACPTGDATCGGYYETIYLKGARFIDRIRVAVGTTLFFSALRDFIAAHRYGLVTSAELLDYLQARSATSLTPIFNAYLS
jgi:hypothetical protein